MAQAAEPDGQSDSESSSSASSSDDLPAGDAANPPPQLPPPDEQRRVIKELWDAHPLLLTEPAHLLSTRWWNLWQLFVGYRHGFPQESYAPGPIDNASIWRDGELISGCRESYEYVVLSDPVWRQLHEWFGGGPDAAVDTATDPEEFGPVVAVIHKVHFVGVYGSDTANMSIYKLVPVKQLHLMMLKHFGVAEDVESRVVDYYQGQVVDILDDAKRVAQCNIIEGQKVVLDVKDESGKWHYEKNKPLTYSGTVTSSHDRSYGSWTGPGIVGLQNLGNTCFFNSALQCLLHTMPLVRYFRTTRWTDEINDVNPIGTHGKVARQFAALVRSAWEGTFGVIDPFELKYEIGLVAPQFQGWAQHDSHELLTILLDSIHEDLNRCREKPYLDTIVGDSTNDPEVALASWENYKRRNNSVILDLFGAQQRSTLVCPKCHNVVVVFDPYLTVQLPLQRPRGPRQVGVKFIPLDMALPPVPLLLTITPDLVVADERTTQANLERLVSQALGREVQCVTGIKSDLDSVSWSLAHITTDDDDSYRRSWEEIWAFEIDQTDDHLWVPCVLKSTKKDYWGYDRTEVVLGPFLVPVNPTGATAQEIGQAAEEQLAWLWDGDDGDERSDDDNNQHGNGLADNEPPGRHNSSAGGRSSSDSDSPPGLETTRTSGVDRSAVDNRSSDVDNAAAAPLNLHNSPEGDYTRDMRDAWDNDATRSQTRSSSGSPTSDDDSSNRPNSADDNQPQYPQKSLEVDQRPSTQTSLEIDQHPSTQKSSDRDRPQSASNSSDSDGHPSTKTSLEVDQRPSAQKSSDSDQRPSTQTSLEIDQRPSAQKSSDRDRPQSASNSSDSDGRPLAQKSSRSNRSQSASSSSDSDGRPLAQKSSRSNRSQSASSSSDSDRPHLTHKSLSGAWPQSASRSSDDDEPSPPQNSSDAGQPAVARHAERISPSSPPLHNSSDHGQGSAPDLPRNSAYDNQRPELGTTSFTSSQNGRGELSPLSMSAGHDNLSDSACRLVQTAINCSPVDRADFSSSSSSSGNGFSSGVAWPSWPASRLSCSCSWSATPCRSLPLVASTNASLTLPASGFQESVLNARTAAAREIDIPRPPAGSGPGVTLDSLLEGYGASERLDEDNQWFCPTCREHVCAEKTMDLWSVPTVMVIQLKRFLTVGYSARKLETPVDYPNEIDMGRFVFGPMRQGSNRYKLYAVSEHGGSLGGGHYTAHAVVEGKGWYSFNDSSAYHSGQADAHDQSGAYLLFYQRIEQGEDVTAVQDQEGD